MAANTAPIFVKNSYVAHARVAAANTNHDGTGTLVDIATGTTEGTRVERVGYAAEVTTTAGVLRFWHYNGTDSRLLKEIAVPANTVSASNPGVAGEWSRSDGQPVITLKSGDKLQMTMEKAEALVAVAQCGDY
jgi:hypothetical protein